MRRWSNYGRLDSQVVAEGDRGFKGVDMTRDRGLLPEGMLARAENKRIRNGSAVTRLGNILPPDFNPFFDNTIIGSGVYSNPNGDEILLIATKDAEWVTALQYGKDPVRIFLDNTLPETLTNALGVEFVQSFDKVLLLRKPSLSFNRLSWTGVNADQFEPVVASGAGTLIDHTWDGEPFQNRVLLYHSGYSIIPWRDQFIMTDVLDFTQYDNILAKFRINSAEADWIMRIYGYFKGNIVVFKRRSTHILSDFTVDPFAAVQGALSRRYGLAAKRAVINVGHDVHFLSEPGGIYKLSEIIQEQISTEPIPISDNIQPLIDRIQWPKSFLSCAEVLGEYEFWAMPIADKPGAVVNGNGCNAICVRNTVSGQWESTPDTWEDPSFRINALHVMNYEGVRSLFAIDYTNSKIYVLYKGPADEIGVSTWPINDLVETRGYTLGDSTGFKRFERTTIALQTADPEITVTAITDGINEEKNLTPEPITKDRLKFYPHGHTDFNPSTGDANEPYRKDYSVGGFDFAGEDFDFLPIGPVSRLPATAFNYSQKQQAMERLSVRANGRWLSLRIENKDGNCDVLSVGVEGTQTMEVRTAA